MDQAQSAALKSYIEARLDWMALPHNSDGAFEIAAILNRSADPEFIVWRTELGPHEYAECYAGDVFDNIALDRIEQWKIWTGTGSQPINPANPEVRAMLANTFSDGHASREQTRAALMAKATRRASEIERILAQGVGTTQEPATLTHQGAVTYPDIQTLLGW